MQQIRPVIFLNVFLMIAFAEASAQDNPDLKSAVRDNYVEEVATERLADVEESGSLQPLDAFSHFMTPQELKDLSVSPSYAAFAITLPGNGIYIRIPVFHGKTVAQVNQGVAMVLTQGPIDKVVLDLRGNRGGLLNAAVEVADEFVGQGTLAKTSGRTDTANLVFLAKPAGLLTGRRVAVLIDAKTASAAELLAGILALNGNAVLVGRNSFGKSAVQSQFALENGESLSLTTAYYRFSDGSTVGPTGLVPGIVLPKWAMRRKPPLATSINDKETLLHDYAVKKALESISQ
jgi:C-terminal processing protease CtpA/Prc